MNFKFYVAVIVSFLLGMALAPRKASAGTGVTMREVTTGYNAATSADSILGFACTHDLCYVIEK